MPSAILLLFASLAQTTATGPAPGDGPQPQLEAAVTLTLRLTDGRRQFRPGEVIPIELEFSSARPKRFTVDGATYDRSGRLTIDEFTIDRIDDVSDPMIDYFGSSAGHIGGGIRGIGVLGEKPFTVTLELNEWFRFDEPGTYTLAVKSRRVTDESVTPHAVVPVASNTVSFEILPRNAEWEAAELETARRTVIANQPPAGARAGCRKMRFLGTEAAAMEMIRRYGADSDHGCDFDFMAGLFGAVDRAAVVRAMEAGLRAANQPVTGSYLRTLATLSVYLQHPGLRPAQTPETKGRLVSSLPAVARSAEAGRSELIEAAVSAYGDILTAAMPDKTGRARAITLAETSALPHAPSAADLALRRLAQLAPDEARPLLLREIQRPRRGATLKTLGSLRDAELADLDDVLAANVEASDSEIHAALVQRYATRKVAPRILASAGDEIGRMACSQQASILAYFLRVDEATGAMLLDRAMASRATGCWRSLTQIADLRMTPVVQARAMTDLDNPDPEVVTAAIQTLGQHGSPAALEPLRAAFQRWHVRWAGRGTELAHSRAAEPPNARQAMVEDAFRQAIGTGRNWLMRAPELRELQALCVTDNCRTQTGHMIHEDDTRIMLWGINEPDESHLELAQYRFTSIAALEEKLARYPRGTVFTLQRSANVTGEVAAAIARLTAFAASHGLSMQER